ncbi:helix-turn-helix domain-containing protein [Streptomyces albus]|uniref:helix-turn-helix domain-containing protein n=1 Tax=Streptomyces albus TaxID=1888 RepID=UPI0034027A69
MGRDWKRLADAIRAARKQKGWTQVQLADAADVSEATVQNLESGTTRRNVPTSLPKVERALGWSAGSGEAVLLGGEPSPLKHDADTSSRDVPDGLPLRIVQELADGPLLDTKVLDLTPLGSDARMIVVVKGNPTASAEQLRNDLLAWAKAQRHLQNLEDDKPDDGESPTANEA